MRVTTVILLTFFCQALSFKFEDAGQEGVSLGTATGNTQPISVEENNNAMTVNLVKITDIVGTITIAYTNQDVYKLEMKDGSTAEEKLIRIQLVDYEALLEANVITFLSVDVLEDSNVATRQILAITIVNVDDEPPTLTTEACTIDENTDFPVADSPCGFTVTDRDGFLKDMTFTIEDSSREESKLFAFNFKEDPDDSVTEATVYLTLIGDQLDYETVQLYSFRVKATDGAGNPTTPLDTVPILVQVGDMGDTPPIWDSFKPAILIDEETPTTLQVSAIDGDFGINNHITYELEDQSGGDFATIDPDTGEISIKAIDFDQGYDQVVLLVTAIEVEDPESKSAGTITLIISDIDDNYE